MGDDTRLSLIYSSLASNLIWRADYKPAAEYAERALALADKLGDLPIQVQARFQLGRHGYAVGDYRRGVGQCEKNIAALRGDLLYDRQVGVHLPSMTARLVASLCLAELGDFSDAIKHGEEAVRIADAGNPIDRVVSWRWMGQTLLAKGDVGRVLPLLERAVAICDEIRTPTYVPGTYCLFAHALVLSGRSADAMRFFAEGIESAVAHGNLFGHSLFLVWQSQAHAITGDFAGSGRLADEALVLARRRGEAGNEAYALHAQGDSAGAGERPEIEAAEQRYRESATLARALGMRPLVAHCHLGLGKLYRRTGKREQAREHLTTATTMYREMGMTYWLEKAEAERELAG